MGLRQFSKYILYIPGRKILRFFFYNIVVKFYKIYIKIIKRLGFKKHVALPAMIQQKLIHIMVLSITVLLIFANMGQSTRAGGLTEKAGQTILSDIIKSEFSGFEEDEQLVIETFDSEINISATQQSYLDNLSSFRAPQKMTYDEVEERNDLFAEEGVVKQPGITDTKITKRARTEVVEYTVMSGDSISTIAQEFEISASTILWENDLSAYSIIRPGDKLKILPTSGLKHTVKSGETLSKIAKDYDIEEKEILAFNKIESSNKLAIGDELIIPGAKKQTYVAYQPTTYTGFSAIKNIVTAPTSATPAQGNMMNWPAQGKITQYYSWRHTGLDIANKTGTAIYAADAGTVEVAGWGTGYGNQIVVNHGGGKKTRYAHLSKFYVEKGDTVTKGQTLAAMGSTGWSTGPHLHFEVIINNQKYNPLSYIK